MGGRLGCVAGLPAGVKAASRTGLCVFTVKLAAQLRCLLAGRCGGFAGLVALVFGLRHALGATVGFFGCALALLDLLPCIFKPWTGPGSPSSLWDV
ncbi:hypothetical protein [Verminephrobacter eiseniae]|uniref:hypothetical protein n=1 Tax=Verminephrobacter eiseniae TaxID=364317 RepID=UPI0022388412|nr:hypothetical protein [Verminephrobacter eiseniae]